MSEDPIDLAGGSNLYAYVEDNPVNAVDPDGKNPIVIGAIAGGLTSAASDFGRQLANCKDINWSSIRASAFFGAITGAATGATVLSGSVAVAVGLMGGAGYGIFVDDPYNAVHYPWEDEHQKAECKCE
jgi:type 1 fimbria pilin